MWLFSPFVDELAHLLVAQSKYSLQPCQITKLKRKLIIIEIRSGVWPSLIESSNVLKKYA